MANSTDEICTLFPAGWVNAYRTYHVLGLVFALFSFISNAMLVLVFMKYEKLRRSYRFYYLIIFCLDVITAFLVVIHKSMLLTLMNNRHLAAFSSVHKAIFTLGLWGTERVSETAECFMVALAATEMFVDVMRYNHRRREKLRYIAVGVAVVAALLLEGAEYFRFEIGPGYHDSVRHCTFPFTIRMQNWSKYNAGKNPYHAVYKRWIQQFITVLLPVAATIVFESLVVKRLIKLPELRREFKLPLILLFALGWLVFLPELIGFLFYHVLHFAANVAQLGLRLSFIVECANFTVVILFLTLDVDVREGFFTFYLTENARQKVEKGLTWLRVRTFRHKQFENPDGVQNGDIKESDSNTSVPEMENV